MLRTMFIIILLVVGTRETWALNEARLLNQSKSGQTVLFNLGFHDGIKEGDYAVVVKQIRPLENRDMRFVPAARARNIKLNSDSSVWILFHVYDPELMVKGDKYVVLSESAMLKGRRDLKIARTTIVTEKSKTKSQIKHSLQDDKNRLSKLKNKYEVLAPTHKTVSETDSDAELLDVDVWEESRNVRYRSALYKSPHKEEFKRQLRLSTFEKLVTAYLRRVNDPEFNYDAFYDEQKKTEFASEFREKANYDSEYNTFLHSQSVRATADAKLYRSILEKGESWSEDYSDEELRNVLGQVSVLQEKDRREWVVAKPNRYSAAFDYGFHLNDTQTKDDPQYRRDSRYSTEIDFEVIPFLKHEALERFTINASFRLNYSAFEVESLNADMNEYSVSLGANWYPLYAPYTVEAPVLLIGTYVRSGFASVESPTAKEKGNYTVMSVPGFRAGMKYLWRNNFGLRLLFSMETLKLERYEASKLSSLLPERTNLVEGKMGVGLAYSF